MSSYLKTLLFYLAGTLCIASFSFYNGFPLINGDTSSYLNAAWQGTVPYERPVFYGWFLKVFSLHYTLWLSILAQCFVVFWTIIEVIKRFSSLTSKRQLLLLTLITLMLTHVGWEANKLLPDVFAGIASLLMLLYLCAKSSRKWLYFIMLIVIGTMHNTHFVLYILVAVTFLFISIWNPIYTKRKLLGILGAGVLSLTLVSLSNYADHGKLELGRSSEVFLVGQTAESGLLYDVLCDECNTKQWKLCAYKDSLPPRGWMYVWNSNSPSYHLGGWDALKLEHKEILKTLYGSPKYWPKLALSSVLRGFTNCFQLDVGDGIFRCEYDSNIQQTIQRYYPADKGEARWNKQYILTIPFQFITIWHIIIIGVLIIVAGWMWSTKRLGVNYKNLILFALVTIYLNSWAIAQFSNISDRLNTRVFWILPFILIIVIVEYLYAKKIAKK